MTDIILIIAVILYPFSVILFLCAIFCKFDDKQSMFAGIAFITLIASLAFAGLDGLYKLNTTDEYTNACGLKAE